MCFSTNKLILFRWELMDTDGVNYMGTGTTFLYFLSMPTVVQVTCIEVKQWYHEDEISLYLEGVYFSDSLFI